MDGLRRGGKLGVAETTGGGALIGAKFGGPLGAAIGAIAGFAAGMVRLFIKGAVEKARQKIKDLYGVDIPDKARPAADRGHREAVVRRQPRHGDPDGRRSAT